MSELSGLRLSPEQTASGSSLPPSHRRQTFITAYRWLRMSSTHGPGRSNWRARFGPEESVLSLCGP